MFVLLLWVLVTLVKRLFMPRKIMIFSFSLVMNHGYFLLFLMRNFIVFLFIVTLYECCIAEVYEVSYAPFWVRLLVSDLQLLILCIILVFSLHLTFCSTYYFLPFCNKETNLNTQVLVLEKFM